MISLQPFSIGAVSNVANAILFEAAGKMPSNRTHQILIWISKYSFRKSLSDVVLRNECFCIWKLKEQKKSIHLYPKQTKQNKTSIRAFFFVCHCFRYFCICCEHNFGIKRNQTEMRRFTSNSNELPFVVFTFFFLHSILAHAEYLEIQNLIKYHFMWYFFYVVDCLETESRRWDKAPGIMNKCQNVMMCVYDLDRMRCGLRLMLRS